MPTTPLGAAILAAFQVDPLDVITTELARSGFTEVATQRLAEFLRGVPSAIAAFVRGAQRDAKDLAVYARSGQRHTGLLVVNHGKVVAAFTFAAEDRDGPASQTSTTTTGWSQTAPGSPRAGPFGRGPAGPLVHRLDPSENGVDGPGEEDDEYLPGWSSVR